MTASPQQFHPDSFYFNSTAKQYYSMLLCHFSLHFVNICSPMTSCEIMWGGAQNSEQCPVVCHAPFFSYLEVCACFREERLISRTVWILKLLWSEPGLSHQYLLPNNNRCAACLLRLNWKRCYFSITLLFAQTLFLSSLLPVPYDVQDTCYWVYLKLFTDLNCWLWLFLNYVRLTQLCITFCMKIHTAGSIRPPKNLPFDYRSLRGAT